MRRIKNSSEAGDTNFSFEPQPKESQGAVKLSVARDQPADDDETKDLN